MSQRTTILLILILAVAVAGFLTACGSHPGESTPVQTGRFRAEYQGAFHCGEQDRESYRATYIITDTETGVRYLAVQGCGTSQLVTAHQGRSSTTVER